MENFMTWESLLTYGGCVAATILLTEFVKKLAPTVIAQLVSFLFAAAILVCGNLVKGTFAVGDIPLYLINAVVASLGANGGFDAIKKLFGKTEVVQNQLIVDPGNEDAPGDVYLSINDDPSAYKDGEILQFQVKKVSQK